MNALTKGLSFMSIVINKTLQQQRGYAVKQIIPIEWRRPVEPLCTSKEKSGDGGIDFGVKSDDPIDKFQKSKELEDADEWVKKLVSVNYNPAKHKKTVEMKIAVKMVQRHIYDYSSAEATVGKMTARILQLQDSFEKNPLDKKLKVAVKEAIEGRQRYLRKLRLRDYGCFEYLIDRMNLVYRPGLRPEEYARAFRKPSTRKLLKKHCDELRQKKLDAYRADLEAQQKDFFKEKAEKLEFIRNEEIACGVEPTVTIEEIEKAKEHAASFV